MANILFRCSDADKERWQVQSAKEGLNLSAWIKSRLDGSYIQPGPNYGNVIQDERVPAGTILMVSPDKRQILAVAHNIGTGMIRTPEGTPTKRHHPRCTCLMCQKPSKSA